MPRPRKCRTIAREYGINFFGPKGVPMRELQMLTLTHVEVEALRLADLEGKYHEGAARSMAVSRRTFARALNSARQKMADALVNGRAIQVEGGSYMIGERGFGCRYWENRGRNGWG